MTTDASEIVRLFHERKESRGRLVNRMEEIQRFANGDVVTPLPELDKNEQAAIPNLISQGLDALAQRIASVQPDQEWPALRPGIDKSEKRSRDRRLAGLGWWDMNDIGIQDRHRARYLVGYGFAPVSIGPVSPNPNDKRQIPHWQVRNPLHVFPAPPAYEGDIRPADTIICHRKPFWWLKQVYPGAMAPLSLGGAGPDTEFEVLSYNDSDETVMVVVGRAKEQNTYAQPGDGGAPFAELERAPNRAGVPLSVMPYRITLDRVQGHFDSITGMYMRQAKLDSLEFIAVKRAVFPDLWVTSHPNAPMKPKIIQYADGVKGVIGEIENGTIQVINPQPSMQGPTAIDRLERSQRVTAGIPADWGGESATNIRTARRGSEVMGATVDQPIAEYQDILRQSKTAELEIAVAVMKGNYGAKSTSFYIPSDMKTGPFPDYTPNDAFETNWNVVKYSMPGADANSLVIAIGQRVGFGEMSLQTAREMDPAIEDPERERNQVENEMLMKAFLEGVGQQASQPGYDPTIIARAAQLHASDQAMTPADAWVKIMDQMKKEQQAQQAAQQAAQPQGPPGAPGQPPMNAGPPGTAIAPAPQSQLNLAQALRTLHQPQVIGQGEQTATTAAQTAGVQ